MGLSRVLPYSFVGQEQVGEGCRWGQEEIREGDGRLQGRSFSRQEGRQEDRQEVINESVHWPFPGYGHPFLPDYLIWPFLTQLRVISLDPN